MRPVFAALILALGLNRPAVAESKPLPADVGSGRVAWFDLTTTNLTKSQAFYGSLLGWRFTPLAETKHAVEIVAGTTAIGTLRVAEGAISAFNGIVYVQVSDLAATCKKASELGGTIPPGFPFDLPDRRGAVAVVVDPVGHPIGLYTRAPLPRQPASSN